MSDLMKTLDAARDAASAVMQRDGFSPSVLVVHAAWPGDDDSDPFDYTAASGIPKGQESRTLAVALAKTAQTLYPCERAEGAPHDG